MKSTVKTLNSVRGLSFALFVLFCVTSNAQENVSCIPDILKVNDKYYIESTGDRVSSVKLLEIDSGSCWIKVKELGVDNLPDEYVLERKKKKYWINVRNVFSIQKQ